VVKEMEQRLGRKLTNDEVSHAVHNSRAKKIKGISTAEVREWQLMQLSPEERQSLKTLCASIQRTGLSRIACSEDQALSHAVAHVFERKSVVPEHELLAAALAHQPGQLDLPALKQAVSHSPELIRTGRGFSTRQILDTEWFLIDTVEAGRESRAPIAPDCEPATWFSEDQQRAILHLLQTTDRITGIRGLAGTGKTTVLRELAAACKGAGIEPLFCAPTAAATDVLRKAGFDATTLQSLLQSDRLLSTQGLVVVDEAGAVGIDDMKRLFELARDCRIVLCGDTGQHASVARGDALRILEEHSSFQSGQLTAIRRQHRADYRRAVELAAQRKTVESFAQLERMGAVREFSDTELHSAAAGAYLKAVKSNKSALLVAPTWNEIEAVTEKVRAALKSSGQLSGEEGEFRVFDSLSWTEAQKRDARQYRPGMMLRFHRAGDGFSRNESVRVITAENDTVRVRRANGSESVFKLSTGLVRFDVGEERTLRVAPGDKLLLQANHQKRLVNGELVEVKAIQGGALVLADDRVIPENYRSFTHGYAITSHAAQGKTADEVLLVASSRSLPAVHQEQFYVSISRGRDCCRIFTDDTELLRSQVTRSSARLAAIEVTHSNRQSRFLRQLLQRGHQFVGRMKHNLANDQSFSRSKSNNLIKTHENRHTQGITLGHHF